MNPLFRAKKPVLLTVLGLVVGPLKTPSAQPGTETNRLPTDVEVHGVGHAYRVTDRFWSGSQPQGAAAFEALARLGIKSIISVDGTPPDVDGAAKHGIRYIHLPISYAKTGDQRVLQLAKAASTLQGPVFVHCHHGKHRGPTAVAIMCRATQGWTGEQAESWLHLAGTGAEYPGLYRSAIETRCYSKEELAAADPLPVLVAAVPIVKSMVGMDQSLDFLKRCQKAGWKSGAKGLPQAAETVLLWEQIREFARTEDTRKRPVEFRKLLDESEGAAKNLADALEANSDSATLDAKLKALSRSCAACHKVFRN